MRCKPYPAGHNEFRWNGRDRLGLPLPAGKYQWLLGSFDGIKTQFVASVGNSGRPPYRTSDGLGSCGGTHGGVTAIASDATGVYLLNAGEEGQPCLRKIDPTTGRAKWFASIGVFGGGEGVTADGKHVWVAVSGPSGKDVKLMRLDAAKGQPAPFNGKPGEPHEIPLGNHHIAAVAVVAGRIYLSETGPGRIMVFDDATGKELKPIRLPKAAGLCRLDNNTLLVTAGSQVTRLDIAAAKAEPLIEGLSDARAVAVAVNGDLYVSDLGDSQQIRRYSSPVGGKVKLLGVFGKAGGRASAVPKWDPMEFRNIIHIATDTGGNLWRQCWPVPRRFIKLSPDGRHLEDFYGPSGFATVGIDADDPTSLYYQAHQYGQNFIQARSITTSTASSRRSRRRPGISRPFTT